RDARAGEVSAFLKAESAAGVGDTDLDRALGAALLALGSDAASDPFVLYLGDGMVTHGESRANELAKRLAAAGGSAKFVGVAVGDRIDSRLLRGLAEATGGLASAV